MISRSQALLAARSASSALATALAPTRSDSFPSFCVPTTPSFSIRSALFSNRSHLIENKGKSPLFKSISFSQFRTLFHFSPGSPLLSTCSPKHTGGIPPSLSRRRRVPHSAHLARAPHPQPSPRGAAQLSPGRKPRVQIPISAEPQRGGTSFDFEFRPAPAPNRPTLPISQGLTTSEPRANRRPAALSAGPPNRVECTLTNHAIPARVAGP
jgi:hypothetical protein